MTFLSPLKGFPLYTYILFPYKGQRGRQNRCPHSKTRNINESFAFWHCNWMNDLRYHGLPRVSGGYVLHRCHCAVKRARIAPPLCKIMQPKSKGKEERHAHDLSVDIWPFIEVSMGPTTAHTKILILSQNKAWVREREGEREKWLT